MATAPTQALVIDDDPTLRGLVVEMIESMGHRATACGCESEAASILDVDRFAYALVDLEIPNKPGRMPGVEYGFRLLKYIVGLPRSRRPLIIVMTSHGRDHALCRRAFRAGADDYLKKPFDDRTEAPTERIRALLGAKRRARGTGTPGPRRAKAPEVRLIGELGNRRRNLTIGDLEVWLTAQQFDLLVRLLAHCRARPGQFLHLDDVKGIQAGPHQAVGRLKASLESQVPGFWGRHVFNDGHGAYRIELPRKHVTWDAALRKTDPDLVTLLKRRVSERGTR